jgi:hypothetical protein
VADYSLAQDPNLIAQLAYSNMQPGAPFGNWSNYAPSPSLYYGGLMQPQQQSSIDPTSQLLVNALMGFQS